MDTIIYALKMALRGLLLMVGLLMLFGGGLCAGLTLMFPRSDLFVMAIATLIALIGWGIFRWGATMKMSSSEKIGDTAQAKDSDAD